MDSGILTGLMISGAGIKAKANAETSGRKVSDDSFSDIFSQRLNKNPVPSNAAGRTGRAVSRDDNPAGITESRNEGRNVFKKAVSAEKRDTASTESSSVKADDTAATEVEDNEPEIKKVRDEIAWLLETLLMKLGSAIPEMTGNKGAEAAEAAGENGISSDAGLITMLQTGLEKLKELLGRMDSGRTDAIPEELNSLADEIEALIARIQKSFAEDGNTAANRLGMTEKDNDDTFRNLVMSLRNQCREIAAKLRSEQDFAENGGQVPTPGDNAGDAIDSIIDGNEAGEDESEAQSFQRQSDDGSDVTAEPPGKSRYTVDEVQTAAEDFRIPNNTAGEFQNPQVQDAGVVRETVSKPGAETVTYLSGRQTAQDVTSQVTMKLKLMAAENRQELEMQLKPESLGKLNLKIIHERGQVLARITAENEQVKAILESNMHLLRDALEKSGYSVQSLDVSVGGRSGDRDTAGTAQRHGQGSRSEVSGPVIRNVSAGTGRLAEILYGIDIPGMSQQIDLIA